MLACDHDRRSDVTAMTGAYAVHLASTMVVSAVPTTLFAVGLVAVVVGSPDLTAVIG